MNDEQNISPPAKGGQGGVELGKCEKCDEYLAGWKRALADYDNLQKDLARERVELRARLKEEIAHQLVAVLDNFDQAEKFKPEGLGKEVEVWLAGLMHVRAQLEGVMREMGLEAYGDVGDLFDPHWHDAGGERQQDDRPDQEILEILQRGWKMGDRVVRPAKIIVNSKPL